MAWLRWEATMKDDPKVVRAGPWGGLAWRAVLEMTKALDWGGVVPAGEVDGLLLARHFGWRGDEILAETTTGEALEDGFRRCVQVGLLVPLEDGNLGIPRWEDMQPDPGSARRVAKHRKKRKALLQAKMRGGDVTVTPPRGGVRVTSGGNGDGTTAEAEATATPTTEAEALRGNDPAPGPKPKRDLRTPVERLLGEKGIHLSSRGGCGISAWRKQLRAATAAGAPDQEVADAIEASSPLDKPWDAMQPITNRYGKASRRDSRGFRIPAGAPRPAPGKSFGEGTRANADEDPKETF